MAPFFFGNYFLDIAETVYRPADTAGPIPKAKIKVARPIVPPNFQPIEIIVNSITALTQAIGKPETF